MTPTNWSMMTISDNNLCTLLDMTKTADTTKTLISQLAIILSANFQHCSSLEEILASNNTGLPADMSGDYSRSKKPKLTDEYLNKDLPATAEDHVTNMQLDTSRNEPNGPASCISQLDASRNNPKGSASCVPIPAAPSSSRADVLKVLSQSPHIIMCCPNKGSMSYILTVPTTDVTQNLSSLPRLQPERQTSRQGSPRNNHLLQGAGLGESVSLVDTEAGEIGRGQASSVGWKNRKISKKGKEKAVDDQVNVMEYIQRGINGLIKPTNLDGSVSEFSAGNDLLDDLYTTPTPTPDHTPNPNPISTPTPTPLLTPATPTHMVLSRTPSARSHDDETMSHDYDPEKFSLFADFLVKMDPVESFPDDDPVTSKSSRTGSLRSTESDPVDSLGPSSVASSGHNSITRLSIPPCMSTVSSEPRATSQENSNQGMHTDTGFSLPEVPMSWLFPEDNGENGEGVLQSQADKSTASDSQSVNLLASSDVSSHGVQNPGASDALMDASGTNFDLDIGPENWQQLLQCSPSNEHQQIRSEEDVTQLIDNFMSSDLDGVQPFTGTTVPAFTGGSVSNSNCPSLNAITAVANIGTGKETPHMEVTTAGSNSWNGMWQNCNPESIKSWLQSSFPLGELLKGMK